jgi:hypothetical protein
MRLKVADTLPAGTTLQCPRCSNRFPLVNGQAAPAAISPGSLHPPAHAGGSPQTPAKPSAPATRLVGCPKCKTPLRVAASAAPATLFKCPKCATSFRTSLPTDARRADAAPLAKPGPKKTALPAAVRQTRLVSKRPRTVIAGQRPTGYRLRCPNCKAVIQYPAIIPKGKKAKCPKCTKIFSTPAPPAPPKGAAAAKTRITPRRPKTKIAPDGRPMHRIMCLGCKAMMTGVGSVPIGRKIQCPRCKKEFVLRRRMSPAAPPVSGKTAPTGGAGGKSPHPGGPGSSVSKKPSTSPTPAPAKAPAGKRTILTKAKATPSAPAAPAEGYSRRRQWPYLVGTILMSAVALAGAGYYFKLGPFAAPPLPDGEWVQFTSPDGRCRLRAPGELAERTDAFAHGPGIVAVRRFALNRPDDEASFLLTYSDRTKEAVQRWTFNALYKEERDYMVKWVDGDLKGEADITVAGHPGKEFRIEKGKLGTIYARIFLVEGDPHDRMYILVAGGAHFRAVPDDARKFFESFALE